MYRIQTANLNSDSQISCVFIVYPKLISMKLPFELVEIIIEHVTESADLLSFGLTCKSLAAVILPYHLFYHTITASIHWGEIWLYFMMNPHLCRYVRRLEVSTSLNPKMRLTDDDVQLEAGQHIPSHLLPTLRPSQELFYQALCKMVNLKAFVWEHHLFTPMIFEGTNTAKKYPNLHFRGIKQSQSRCASAFDTPIVDQLSNLVSITLESSDFLDYGSSILNLLGACRELKYLSLSTARQSLAGKLVTSCRWPNLEVLSLSIRKDFGSTWTKETINEFFEFHSNIVSLRWSISFQNHCPPIAVFLPGCFSRLRALEGDAELVRSIVTGSYISPRPLVKILNFPIDEELWKEPEIFFRGIDRSSLRIISFNPSSLSQLTDFGRFFPNVECLDISDNSLSDLIWDSDMRQFRKAMLAEYADKLSSFQRLKIIFGIHFFDGTESEEENQRRLGWVDHIFPRLEFCASYDTFSGASLIRDDGLIRLEFIPPMYDKAQSMIDSKYDVDFIIPEEYDRNIL